jgi:hypothetical protein
MLIDLFAAEDKYNRQRHRAKQRGVDFKLSFEDWMNIWLESGHWNQRGKGKGKYNMSRIDDAGSYEVGNVFIQSHEHNARDGHKDIPKTPEHKFKSGLGRKLAWQRFREAAYGLQ